MYAATVDSRALTFAVSGLLWNRSLVMVDQQTGSLWSHILGLAMQGPLEGSSLQAIPSVMTTWEAWKTKHPDSTVLAMSRTAKDFKAEFQRRPGRFVYGVVLRGQARAYPFDLLNERPVLSDSVGEIPVVVTFEPRTTACRIFESRLGDRPLTFHASAVAGQMTDRETESVWEIDTGTCVAGRYQGLSLKTLAGIVSFADAWKRFHPESINHGVGSPGS